jgi:type I restriction enzyme S subunit
MKYKFEDIIFNITEKKKPVEEDKYNYIGLEHLESGNLFISKWGSDTAPEGEKIVMKKVVTALAKMAAVFGIMAVSSFALYMEYVRKQD